MCFESHCRRPEGTLQYVCHVKLARNRNRAGAGVKTAEAISKKAKIPLERVHSLLSYHRRMGSIKGFTGDLKANKA